MIHHRTRVAVYHAALWLGQIRVLTGKELRQFVRDRTLLGFIVYVFTLNILIAAGEGTTDLHDARVVVRDADRSAASREFIYRFRAPYFRYSGEVAHPDQGLRLLEQGKARMLLEIPEQFERTLRRGEQPAHVQALIDTSKANSGFLASSYTARITAGFARDWAERYPAGPAVGERRLPVIENRDRIWYNPGLNESWFGTIAELLSMITVICILLPASALVREKERGTIEQLLVSPLTPFQVMFPKVLALILVTLAGAAVSIFGIILPLIAVPLKGSLALFFAVTALYAFTTAGLGLAAATFARTSGQAGMLVLLIVMPMLMLSGIRTPLESMPEWLRTLIYFSPLQHYIEISYGILLRGAGLATLWDSVLKMALMGGVLFSVGAWRFRRQFR
jgi:ABC-2 type transport system permease protein